MTLEQARHALLIDKNNLEEELIRQARIHEEIGREAAIAESLAEGARNSRSVAEVEAMAQIRKEAVAANAKITDSKLMVDVKAHPHYLQAAEKYAEARKAVGEWQAVLESSRQRPYLISDLVKLFLSGLGRPYVPADSVEIARPGPEVPTVDQLARKRVRIGNVS